ncbi:sensor histidine kinase [Streptomyces abyssomicinicus]|uniref:sensor histidine kinase n=1 Tax=Streptomyces abyssomicinicus TaxID=574929 RepID=UPI0012506D1C|nr:nitrate- and nitrite sensing domain-containing protein [Streptomyces abyssomicinicus]
MRFRGTSIRRKIVALLIVPLMSLTGIWAFTSVLTTTEANRMFTVATAVDEIGYPVEEVVVALQAERRQTLVHLASPDSSDIELLMQSWAITDDAMEVVRANAAKEEVREALGSSSGLQLDGVLETFWRVETARSAVDRGASDRTEAYAAYNTLIDECFTLLTALPAADTVELDQQARAVVNLFRVRELLAREDALLGSGLVVGEATGKEIDQISDLVAQRSMLVEVSLPMLPQSDRARHESYWQESEAATALGKAELRAMDGDRMTARSWDTIAGTALANLQRLNDETADRYQERVGPVARNIILKVVAGGILGLLAVLASIVVSVRVGRGLVRDLRGLSREAHEASGVRLPSVMRRLSGGEKIDVEAEMPPREFPGDEMGEVGRALDSLQRAAVEAAVKQAELRSGVSEVFVNLARRSQVLLHRQLTLLDTMERRAEDTDELADLFRLDHLTTRMRRHAEGLVILSGAAPARQWRKPVRLMDVVRAAAAEVEDYERVEVRRLPRLSVKGPAVADLTHLLAELLENATVFSPPHTAVQVIGERLSTGFLLQIHDRGLGMSAEARQDANERLAETPDFELSDTDRLGLFVVSRLARRQNVKVSLQPSPYGGTTAVVLLPERLLTEEEPESNGSGLRLDRARVATRKRISEAERTGELELVEVIPLQETLEEPLGGEPSSRGGLRVPRDEPDTEPATEHAAVPDSEEAAGGPVRPVVEEPRTAGGLPRRVRQASLAPQLKDSPDQDPAARRQARSEAADPAARDAEELRDRMASLQHGWQRGREENDAVVTATGRDAGPGTACREATGGARTGTVPATTKRDDR